MDKTTIVSVQDGKRKTMIDTQEVVGILMAAGRGTRFSPDGSRNKLLARLDGQPVCVTVARTFRQAIPRVVAATSPHSPDVASTLRDEGCEIVTCDRSAQGMGNTIAQAVAQIVAAQHAAGKAAPAWCILPGDMPRLSATTIGKLVDTWRAMPADQRVHAVLAPAHAGVRGHPVLLGPGWTGRLMTLQGDAGARALIAPHMRLVAVDDPGCLFDVDTQQALADAAGGVTPVLG